MIHSLTSKIFFNFILLSGFDLCICPCISLSLSLFSFFIAKFQDGYNFVICLSLPLSLSSLPVLYRSASPLLPPTLPPTLPSPPRPAPRDRLFPLPDPRSLLILSQNRSQGNEKTSIFLRFFNYLHQP